MGFLHVLGKLVRLYFTYAIIVYVLDPDLVAALDIKVDTDCAADDGIFLDVHVHIYLEVPFFLVVALYNINRRRLYVV